MIGSSGVYNLKGNKGILHFDGIKASIYIIDETIEWPIQQNFPKYKGVMTWGKIVWIQASWYEINGVLDVSLL
jgi:hypothetical protein